MSNFIINLALTAITKLRINAIFTKFSLFLIAASLAAAVNANAIGHGCDTSFADMPTQFLLDSILQDPNLYLDSTEWNERGNKILIPPFESSLTEGDVQYNYDFQFGGYYDPIPGKDRLVYKLPAKIKLGDFYTMGAHSSLPTDSVMRYMIQDIMTWLFKNDFTAGIVYLPSCWTKYNYAEEFGQPDGESFDGYTFQNPPVPPDPTLYKWVPCPDSCCVLTFNLRNSAFFAPDGKLMTEAYNVTVQSPDTIPCPPKGDPGITECTEYACGFLQNDYGHFPRPTRVFSNDCWCGNGLWPIGGEVDFSIDSSNYSVDWSSDLCNSTPPIIYTVFTEITSPDMSNDKTPYDMIQAAIKAMLDDWEAIGFQDDTTRLHFRIPTCWREYESGFGLNTCSEFCCEVEYEIIKVAPDEYIRNTISSSGNSDTCFYGCVNLCNALDLGQNFKRSINNVKADKYESIVVPNPTSAMTEIMLKGDIEGQLKLEIVNNLGRVVATFYTESKTFRFDSGAFASGVYHYRIRTDLEIISNGKFIIE